MLLNRAQIVAMIPHGASMCMLDEVTDWNREQINCRSQSFTAGKHPLCEADGLDNVLLIEYGAQAAAVHSALLQSNLGTTRPAYIGAIKEIELSASLSNSHQPIEISAECLFNSGNGAIYQVKAEQGGIVLMRGRLTLNQP